MIEDWIPASAGMTDLDLFVIPAEAGIHNSAFNHQPRVSWDDTNYRDKYQK